MWKSSFVLQGKALCIKARIRKNWRQRSWVRRCKAARRKDGRSYLPLLLLVLLLRLGPFLCALARGTFLRNRRSVDADAEAEALAVADGGAPALACAARVAARVVHLGFFAHCNESGCRSEG